MPEKESTRRKFLKFLGLSAGATLVSSKLMAGIIKPEDIRKLNPHQQEFMVDYGKWMSSGLIIPASIFELTSVAPAERPKNFKNFLRVDSFSDIIN